jgi:hypothetical protein
VTWRALANIAWYRTPVGNGLDQSPTHPNTIQHPAETTAAPGIVKIHAQITSAATAQRTALARFNQPIPRIDPVMVCVVLTGIPPKIVSTSVAAAPVSAQNPSTGRR